MTRVVHLGTSGWQYESWKGLFYPRELRPPDWLPFYATQFATVEVNTMIALLEEREIPVARPRQLRGATARSA